SDVWPPIVTWSHGPRAERRSSTQCAAVSTHPLRRSVPLHVMLNEKPSHLSRRTKPDPSGSTGSPPTIDSEVREDAGLDDACDEQPAGSAHGSTSRAGPHPRRKKSMRRS